MTSTATLMERRTVQLAGRAGTRQGQPLRNQAAEWIIGGLNAPRGLTEAIHKPATSLGRCRMAPRLMPRHRHFLPSSKLTTASRHSGRSLHQPGLSGSPSAPSDARHCIRSAPGNDGPKRSGGQSTRRGLQHRLLADAWPTVEEAEGDFPGTANDQLLDWAITAGFHVVGGPLIDFQRADCQLGYGLGKDLAGIASFMLVPMPRRRSGVTRAAFEPGN